MCQLCIRCGMCNHGTVIKEPRPTDVCPCGHGKRYKDCCGRDAYKSAARQEAGQVVMDADAQ